MTAAALYGSALLLSGWFLSRGVAEAHRRRSMKRLGYQRRAGQVKGIARSIRLREENRRHVRLGVTLLAGGCMGYALLGPVGILIGLLAATVILRARDTRRRVRRRDLLDRQLGEAVATMAAAVRAGLSVRRSVTEAADSAEPPLRDELASVVQRLETGEPLDTALARLARRLGLSDADLLVGALAVHRRTGGDMPSLLDEIAGVVRVRLEDRRAVRALTAQARSSGVVLAVLPVAFVALLSGTGGDGLGAFYRTPSGVLMLLIALSLQAVGFLWMRLILKGVDDA